MNIRMVLSVIVAHASLFGLAFALCAIRQHQCGGKGQGKLGLGQSNEGGGGAENLPPLHCQEV